MFAKRILAISALLGLTAGPLLAQPATTPATPTRPAMTAPATPPATPSAAPATPAVRATPAPSAAATGSKVNLNSASAKDLDALPTVGKARSKAILDERAKGPFKDWADFDKRMAGSSINAGVKSKIKDHVTF